MKLKIIIAAIGITIFYQGRNFLLDRLKSQEMWQKKRFHDGCMSIKKFEDKGSIGEDCKENPHEKQGNLDIL